MSADKSETRTISADIDADITNFKPASLKHTKVHEKCVLPTSDGKNHYFGL